MAGPTRSSRATAPSPRTSALPAPASTPRLDEPGLTPPRPTGRDDGLMGGQGLRARTKRARGEFEPAYGVDGRVDGSTSARDDDEDDGASMLRWGWILVVVSATSFTVGLWSMLIGPLCSPTGWAVLDAMAQDTYYKYLVVLLIPVTTCFVIVNWWGLKIFRHA